jgi:hypothetical protein
MASKLVSFSFQTFGLYGTAFRSAIKIFGESDVFRKEVRTAVDRLRFGMGEQPRPGNPPQIRSEASGPHWVAWVADTTGKPLGSVVLVGETREEAEERARKWGEQA